MPPFWASAGYTTWRATVRKRLHDRAKKPRFCRRNEGKIGKRRVDRSLRKISCSCLGAKLVTHPLEVCLDAFNWLYAFCSNEQASNLMSFVLGISDQYRKINCSKGLHPIVQVAVVIASPGYV